MGAPEEIKFPPEEEKEDVGKEEREEVNTPKYFKYFDNNIQKYLELDSDDIKLTIKFRPENRVVFYKLLKKAKAILLKDIDAGKLQSEVIMISMGYNKFKEILNNYNMEQNLNFCETLILYFEGVPGIYRIPVLDLSMVFNRDRHDEAYIHINSGDLNSELVDISELFGDRKKGEVTMICTYLSLGEILHEQYYDDRINNMFTIEDRLKNAFKEYNKSIMRHIAFIKPGMELDIKNYRREVEDGDGDPKKLKMKEKMLKKLTTISTKDDSKDSPQYNDRGKIRRKRIDEPLTDVPHLDEDIDKIS